MPIFESFGFPPNFDIINFSTGLQLRTINKKQKIYPYNKIKTMNKVIAFLALITILVSQVTRSPMPASLTLGGDQEPGFDPLPTYPDDASPSSNTLSTSSTRFGNTVPVDPNSQMGPSSAQPNDFQGEPLPAQAPTKTMTSEGSLYESRAAEAQKSAMDAQLRQSVSNQQAFNILQSGDESKRMSTFGWPSWFPRCRLCAYIYYKNSNYRLTRWWNNKLVWTMGLYSSKQLWTLEQLGIGNGVYRISNGGYYITQNAIPTPWTFLKLTSSPNTSSSYWQLQGETGGRQELTYVKNWGYLNSYWRAASHPIGGLVSTFPLYDHPFKFVFYPCKRRYYPYAY